MKALHAVLVALVAVFMVTSVAAAGPDAAKQQVVITVKGLDGGTFVLEPQGAGALERDSGTTSIVYHDPRKVMRDGQRVDIYDASIWTLKGKRGTLTIRERSGRIQTGDAVIATGTWKLVRGTGEYAKATGHGRSAHVGHNRGNGAWYTSAEGFLIPK